MANRLEALERSLVDRIKIVLWDNIGNTVLGVRPWDVWPESVHERLITEDPEAQSKVVSWKDLLKSYDVELVWLYDPVKSQRGFRNLFEEYRDYLRPVDSPADLADAPHRDHGLPASGAHRHPERRRR